MAFLYGLSIFLCGAVVSHILLRLFWNGVALDGQMLILKNVEGNKYSGYLVEESEYKGLCNLIERTAEVIHSDDMSLEDAQECLQKGVDSINKAIEKNTERYGDHE